PGGDILVFQQPGNDERDHDPDRDRPVVADDEVVPEEAKVLDELHQASLFATTSRARCCRSEATKPNDTMSTKARTPMIAASPPGQLAPTPSALQKVPKVVSITPTANFIVFSGTRLSGAWMSTPTAPTMMIAAAAPIAA